MVRMPEKGGGIGEITCLISEPSVVISVPGRMFSYSPDLHLLVISAELLDTRMIAC